MADTLFVFQGGGPTAVINATLAGVAESAAGRFKRLLGLVHSFEGGSDSRVLDLSSLLSSAAERELLSCTPGAILGSSRKKVEKENLSSVLSVMQHEGSTDIVGIGGNGTAFTLQYLAQHAASQSYPVSAFGAPKTVDNDIPGVDLAPGYGSAALFVALAVRDSDCDFRAMSTFDDVTILETMGRNTGWLAAASVLLKEKDTDAPHMVLVPERPVDLDHFLAEVKSRHKKYGRVFIVSNEVLHTPDCRILGEDYQDGPSDALGRKMFSLSTGTGNYLANQIWKTLGLQSRCLRPGNLGRAFSSCVSSVDRELAKRVGRAAVENLPDAGPDAIMLGINRDGTFGTQSAEKGKGQQSLHPEYLNTKDPYAISPLFRQHYLPAIGAVSPIKGEFLQ